MAKKDPENTENNDRVNEQGKAPVKADRHENDMPLPEKETEVKNAHASGLGSMGRNDQGMGED